MDIRYLNIQQYINRHPLLLETMDMRLSYMAYLKLLILASGRLNDWEKQIIALYENVLLSKTYPVSYDISELTEEAEKKSIIKYRYMLLTDGLFIKSFFDKNKMSKEILINTISLFNKKYRENFRKLYDAFYTDGSVFFPNAFKKLRDVYQIVWENRRILNQKEKRVMIAANMSAGKSTLLNALSGKTINKTQNDSCTAKIHFLHNKAGEDGLNYELDYDFEIDASHEILMNDNEKNKSLEIHVGTFFRSLNSIRKRICFIDTPGVNSSLDKEHRVITENTIMNEKCDLLLYVFNGENIGSDDDKKLLDFVKNHYHGRIIFLLNRVDHYKKGMDSLEDTLEKERMDLLNMGFADPEIYPISAYAAYLGKLYIFGESLPEEEIEEMNDLKRRLKKEDFSYERFFSESAKPSINVDNTYEQLLLNSGILSLEEIINNI